MQSVDLTPAHTNHIIYVGTIQIQIVIHIIILHIKTSKSKSKARQAVSFFFHLLIMHDIFELMAEVEEAWFHTIGILRLYMNEKFGEYDAG